MIQKLKNTGLEEEKIKSKHLEIKYNQLKIENEEKDKELNILREKYQQRKDNQKEIVKNKNKLLIIKLINESNK